MSKSVKNAANFVERKITAMYSKVDVWQGRVARLLFILMCCVMPLYLNPAYRYFYMPQHKWNFFIASMILVLLIVVIIWLYRIANKPRILPQDTLNITDWAIIGFAIVTLVSTIFSPFRHFMDVWVGNPEPEGRYDGAYTQLLYVAIFFIISRWYKPREKDFMWFSTASIIISLIGIFQFFGMDFLRLWPNHMPAFHQPNLFNIFIRSTLGNTNTVSVFVTLAALFTGFLFVRKSSKWQPLWLCASALNIWLWVIADADSGTVGIVVAMLLAIPFIIQNMKSFGRTLILVSAWVITYTAHIFFFEVVAIETRNPATLLPFIVAFAVMLAIGIILAKRSKEPDSDAPPKWKLGVILIVALIVIGIVGVEILGRPDANGYGSGVVYEVREILHGNIRDEFGTNRVYIWRHALSVFPYRPIIGYGPDTFLLAFPFEAQEYFGEVYDTAHNEYIQYLISQGILGLLAYLVFVVTIVITSVRKAFKEPIIAATLVAFVGYLAQAFFNISHPIASQILWVFAGILMSRRLNENGRFEHI